MARPAPATTTASGGYQLTLTPGTVRLSAFYEAGRTGVSPVSAGGAARGAAGDEAGPSARVIRVYESSGVATEAVLEVPFEVTAALKTDFNLEPLEGPPAVASGRTVRVPLRTWEIATVLLT